MENKTENFEQYEIIQCVNSSLSDRIAYLMKGRSVRQVAEDWKVGASTVNAYIKNGSVPNLNIARNIADRENVSLNWLATGFSEPNQSDFKEDFSLIPEYDSKNPDRCEPMRCLAYSRNWLEHRGFKENDLVIVWAKGDSMEPTIHNNDTLVVHKGRNKLHDGNIYIFRNRDELFVKRYQNALGSWRLISDNPLYDRLDVTREEQDQFEVVGQVVHIAKDIAD